MLPHITRGMIYPQRPCWIINHDIVNHEWSPFIRTNDAHLQPCQSDCITITLHETYDDFHQIAVAFWRETDLDYQPHLHLLTTIPLDWTPQLYLAVLASTLYQSNNRIFITGFFNQPVAMPNEPAHHGTISHLLPLQPPFLLTLNSIHRHYLTPTCLLENLMSEEGYPLILPH